LKCIKTEPRIDESLQKPVDNDELDVVLMDIENIALHTELPEDSNPKQSKQKTKKTNLTKTNNINKIPVANNMLDVNVLTKDTEIINNEHINDMPPLSLNEQVSKPRGGLRYSYTLNTKDFSFGRKSRHSSRA